MPLLHDCSLRSFDIVRDGLGGPRSTFPHSVMLVAGTQASTPRQNYIAFLKLAELGQGRHGKRKGKAAGGGEDDDEDDEESSDMDSEAGSMSGDEDGDKMSEDGDAPAKFHYRCARPAGLQAGHALSTSAWGPASPYACARWH